MMMFGNFLRQLSAPLGVENIVTRTMLLSLTPWSFNTPRAVMAVSPLSEKRVKIVTTAAH